MTTYMTVQELQEKLDLIDSECEILIIDDKLYVHGVEDARLDVYFDNEVDNGKSPFCIRIN